MALLAKLANKHIDALTAELKDGGLGIHIEDIEQVMGRVTFGGEKKPGKRTLMSSLNVLRTTRDIDWVKLRDQCGDKFKQHTYKGETYVSLHAPGFLQLVAGPKGECYLWAADARTLVCDSDKAIMARIDAKVSGNKPEPPAGWDAMSRGLLAIALNNHGNRLMKRCLTDEEMKLMGSTDMRVAHAMSLWRDASELVAGCAGDDDFRVDFRLSAEDADAAARVAEHCTALVAAAKAEKKAVGALASEEDSVEVLLMTCAAGATVRRSGTTVTVHGEVASGLNALLAAYAKEILANEK
jgi:hypothetical protein